MAAPQLAVLIKSTERARSAALQLIRHPHSLFFMDTRTARNNLTKFHVSSIFLNAPFKKNVYLCKTFHFSSIHGEKKV